MHGLAVVVQRFLRDRSEYQERFPLAVVAYFGKFTNGYCSRRFGLSKQN